MILAKWIMASTTVIEFADAIRITVESLQEELIEAGVGKKSPEDILEEEEKSQLLVFLQKKSNRKIGAAKLDRTISLTRKTRSEIKTSVGSTGAGSRTRARTKTVSVEYRQRRVYAKKSDIAELKRQKEAVAQSEPKSKDELVPEIKVAKKPEVVEVVVPEKSGGNESADPKKESANKNTAREVKKEAPSLPKEKSAANTNKRRKHTDRKELHVKTGKSGRRQKKNLIQKSAPVVAKHAFEKPTAPIVRDVDIPESISVFELAQKMSVKSSELIKVLMELGTMVTINQTIDQDTAVIVVEEMGHKPRLAKDDSIEESIHQLTEKIDGELLPRPAVVTVMGHVDHGKTSLLDYIRSTKITADEAGGITQHIGAYQVDVDGKKVTFLDTPGHEAFAAMRARGAKVTDIAVVVVAADDGVMPQTEEAIKHARAASVPIIIAINKIDKQGADTDKVRQALAQHEVISEDWGGDTIFVEVSALTGKGIDELLENILLQAEILELQAVYDCSASGVVIESKVDKGRGPVATVLLKNGTLKKGNILISGREYGRVRAIIDDTGQEISVALPAMPVEILGLTGAPNAGDEMIIVGHEKQARELALFRQEQYRELKIARQQSSKRQNLLSQMENSEQHNLNLLVKGDAQGSVEAIIDALGRLSNDEVKISIISSGVGGISESDVNLAMASDSEVIGFNVRADASARKLLAAENIVPRYYSVIYDVVDDVKLLAGGMLSPEIREQIIGTAQVRDIFVSSKFGDVAGCIVIDGVIKHNRPIRVLRDNVVLYEGELESLRRFKNDVHEVKSGTECGIGVKNYTNVKVGDQIEVFERIEIQRQL